MFSALLTCAHLRTHSVHLVAGFSPAPATIHQIWTDETWESFGLLFIVSVAFGRSSSSSYLCLAVVVSNGQFVPPEYNL